MSLADLKQKLVLGTVQLGLPYGINNQAGKPDRKEAHSILDKAAEEKIRLLDSADAYGDSLNVIGSYLNEQKHRSFALISKFIGGDEPLRKRIERNMCQNRAGQPLCPHVSPIFRLRIGRV